MTVRGDALRTQSPESFLFTSLVKSHLGEQLALLVSTLISHGTLSISQLVSYTKLPVYNIKQTLVSLVQMNIVTYYTDVNSVTRYSFQDSGCLKLVYSGEIINSVSKIYQDDLTTKIVQSVLQFGYLTYLNYQDLESGSEDQFLQLISDKWLIPINKQFFQTKYDLYDEIFKKELLKFNRDNKTTSESKKIAEVKQLANNLFVQVLAPTETITKIVEGEKRIIPQIPFTVNLKRFFAHSRTRFLSDLCRHKIGPLSARIYQVALNRLESRHSGLDDDYLKVLQISNNIMVTSTGLDPQQVEDLKASQILKNIKTCSFNANDILREIQGHNKREDDKIIVQNSIIEPSSLKRDESSEPVKKKIKLEFLDEEMPSNNELDESSIVLQHLKILTQNKFLKESSPGKFHVPLYEIEDTLKKENLNQLIKLVFGPNACRIVNCIQDLKLIDEKMLNNVLLMKDSTIRSNLNKLITHNILQIQEIPKTNDRLAIRTVFSFRFKSEDVISGMKSSLYYNLGEIVTNIGQLRSENKILLDKCNREDVRGKEVEVLIESELVKLNQIYEEELQQLSRYSRILSMVGILQL